MRRPSEAALCTGTLILALWSSSLGAQLVVEPLPKDCKEFLHNQLQQGGELIRILALESVPDMSQREWSECRQVALTHVQIAYERQKAKKAAELREWVESLKHRPDPLEQECMAKGGEWRKSIPRSYCVSREQLEHRARKEREYQQGSKE